MKLVVVGNGMAGMRVVEELLKIAPDIYNITVFGDEPYPNYNRIMLSPVLANEQTINDIILNTREWYAENNITLYTSARINKIDRKNRVFTLKMALQRNMIVYYWLLALSPLCCRFQVQILRV